jgi:hypothetical protein
MNSYISDVESGHFIPLKDKKAIINAYLKVKEKRMKKRKT